ncbi:unannotated protein [freshwater metagenome]|uniref:Unannotated protein n=1 Tax=freshwater metagenome TaxID=449393 RepID=A0A6J6MRP4_9ZZZZ
MFVFGDNIHAHGMKIRVAIGTDFVIIGIGILPIIIITKWKKIFLWVMECHGLPDYIDR